MNQTIKTHISLINGETIDISQTNEESVEDNIMLKLNTSRNKNVFFHANGIDYFIPYKNILYVSSSIVEEDHDPFKLSLLEIINGSQDQ